jgi:hypothetical protein
MMSLRLCVFTSVLLGAVAACSDGSNGAIDYQRTGGFVGLQLSLRVEPDGKMTRHKSDGSTVTGQLDAATLAGLQRKVDDARFPTLEAAYSCSCADDFLHTISVQVDGTEYTVMVDDTATYPDRLRPLIDALETMTEEVVAF